MKSKIIIGIFVIAGAIAAFAFTNNSNETVKKIKMKNELDSVSYSLGVNIANNLRDQGMTEINSDLMASAISHVFEGADLAIEEQKTGEILNSYFQKLQVEKEKELRKAGEDFLAENKSKEGVVTLPSGLQYMVMKEGTGPKPTLTDKVTTHYHGTTIDGKVFDSSVERNQPASFPVNGVIKGWTEALQLMSVGSKWKLFIPSDLAYGARGAGPKIGPHSTLIFEVELLSIDK